MSNNLLICPGDACALRLTCLRFHAWVDNEDDDPTMEIVPDNTGKCIHYLQKEFYGQ